MASQWSLSDKVAVVTGANSGIGLETVKMLLNAGDKNNYNNNNYYLI